MKKMTRVIACLLAMAMMLTSCGGSGDTAKETKKAGETAAADQGGDSTAVKKLKVALILPGKKDDVSFNQAMYEGITAYADAHTDEIELKVVENVYEVADIEPALLDFADQGYDVIFGHGFQFMEPIVKVAPNYPDTCFLLGTGYKTTDNSAGWRLSHGRCGSIGHRNK